MRRPCLTAVLCALAAPPIAAGEAGLQPLQVPPIGHVAAAAVPVPVDSSSFVPPDLWARLPALSPVEARWLGERIPGFDASKARRMTMEEVEPIIESFVAAGLSGMDLFTDPGFREGGKAYYIPLDVLDWLESRYTIGLLFTHRGRTEEGQDFVMQGTVVGRSSIEILYSLDDFSFKHPYYQDHGGRYTFRSHIHEDIEGPGRLRITGVKGPRGFDIQGLIKVAPDRVRVVIGGFFDSEKPLLPIARKH